MLLPYANLKVRHQNPEATMPLILPVHVICNTSDDDLYNNVRINSKLRGNWVKCLPEHDGMAIIVGSGPSLADTIEDVRQLKLGGGTIFALNGAAKFLNDNGILPDYQVLLDARQETATLISKAKKYLFASQVHPDCFAAKPEAQLWHLQIGDIENELEWYEPAYALIGGAASVGNTTTCLAYTLGYRNLHLFGYDSSHKNGCGHAFHQKMNEGDPCAVVRFNGKEYTASFTMKLQAEKFRETAQALVEAGVSITVHGTGLLPDMWANPDITEYMTEQEKYEQIWQMDAYRIGSPGERCAENFFNIARPSGKVIDFGSGTGRGSLKIKEYGCSPFLVDFAYNSRDKEALSLPFLQHDLTKRLPDDVFAKYGYCTDVMEHIAPENVRKVINNIMDCVDYCFFQICVVDDLMGDMIGQTLHLTVKPQEWWQDLFEELGYNVLEAHGNEIASMFYVKKRVATHKEKR